MLCFLGQHDATEFSAGGSHATTVNAAPRPGDMRGLLSGATVPSGGSSTSDTSRPVPAAGDQSYTLMSTKSRVDPPAPSATMECVVPALTSTVPAQDAAE